ncbi:MAG: hypothetical protein US49_C0005G0029 [candidate division TM6 bacterium GW2011_GWF2_37_49]|nr:MAG: hypothetical protein US49_C0005G0029 [candidate division TM6 bacterium GW2011_GWF2_37_49]
MMSSVNNSYQQISILSVFFLIQLFKFCECILINLWLGQLSLLQLCALAFHYWVEVFGSKNFNLKKGGYADYDFQVA